jgi:hypothetical protein
MKIEDIDKKIGMPDVDEEWAKFEREVIDEETKPQKRVFIRWTIGIAASIALALGIFLWGDDEEKQIDSSRKVAQVTKVKTQEENNVADGDAIKEDTTRNNPNEVATEINSKDIPANDLLAQTTPPTNDMVEEQTPAVDNMTNNVFAMVEQQPLFRGGNKALQEFIRQNLRYPPMAQAYGVEGRVVMRFLIDSLGYVSDIKAAKHILKYDTLLLNHESEARQIQLKEQIAQQLEEECARVIAMMPRWAPGRMYGNSVNMKYNLPFQFQPSNMLERTSDSDSLGANQ